jgi:hypothetical protein
MVASMIYPTDEQLLAGIADALKDSVLPDLARGTAARKQLQAAIEILRRMAFAAPGRDAVMAADNADMAEVLAQIREVLGQTPTSISGDAIEVNKALQTALADLQNDFPPDLTIQITSLLTGLYKHMTNRALALIPPPMPRTPRKSA